MRPLVIDASVVVPWIVPEATSEAASRLRGRDLLAPDLLFSEVANALWKKIRRGELSIEEAEAVAHLLAAVPLVMRTARELLPRAVRLAAELDHPAYDCIFLALAEAADGTLVTDDRRLARVVAEQADGRYRALVLPLREMPGRSEPAPGQAAVATSSVTTVNCTRVVGPKVLLIATSAASRPRAISTRPIRGTLLRGSKVCQSPPR